MESEPVESPKKGASLVFQARWKGPVVGIMDGEKLASQEVQGDVFGNVRSPILAESHHPNAGVLLSPCLCLREALIGAGVVYQQQFPVMPRLPDKGLDGLIQGGRGVEQRHQNADQGTRDSWGELTSRVQAGESGSLPELKPEAKATQMGGSIWILMTEVLVEEVQPERLDREALVGIEQIQGRQLATLRLLVNAPGSTYSLLSRLGEQRAGRIMIIRGNGPDQNALSPKTDSRHNPRTFQLLVEGMNQLQ